MKKENEVIIRSMKPEDTENILAIYSPYIETTAITCECSKPKLDEFRKRIINISNHYPFIVAELNGVIIGYAYANHFNSRYAFRFSVETSIYISLDMHKKGIGTILYKELEEQLKRLGIKNLYANIVSSDNADENLTGESLFFHKKLGFKEVGKLTKCAYKFNKWYDIIWMEKII